MKASIFVTAQGIVPVRELIIPDDLEQKVAECFTKEKTKLPKTFLKKLSRILTERFKKINQGKGPCWGKGKLDSYLMKVIGRCLLIVCLVKFGISSVKDGEIKTFNF